MVNVLYRFLFTALGMTPLSYGFLCSGKNNISEIIEYGLYSTLLCILALLIFKIWIQKVTHDHEGDEVNVESVSLRHSSPAFYFLAYVLPLVLSEQLNTSVLYLIITLLFFLCFISESEDSNPIIKLAGFYFYEVSDNLQLTYIVMSSNPIHAFLNKNFKLEKIKVIKIYNGFYLHVR